MRMYVRQNFFLIATIVAVSLGACANVSAQSITSTVYESYLNDSNLVDANGNPVNIYPVAFNVNTNSPVQINYPGGFSQPDYVTGADNEIAILSLGAVYEPTFPGEIGAPSFAGPFNTYAYGDYGQLHAYSNVYGSNDGYFQAVASSSFTDTLSVSSSNVLETPTYEQFVFDIAGSLSGDAAAILQVSAADLPPAPNVLGGVATSSGNLNAYDDHYSQSFFGPSEEDSFQFSGSGTAIATTQAYNIAHGQVTPTVSLTANSNFEVSGQPVGSADFADTVTLADILVYNQNGQLIPSSDLTFSDASGASYAFMPGSASAPETGTLACLALSIALLSAMALRSRRYRAA